MIWIITTAALLIPMFFLLAGLAITVWSDPYISRKHRMILLAIVALSVSLIAQNLLEDHIAAESPQWFWRTTLAIYGYTVRPVLLILFLYIIQPEKKHLPAWGLAAVNWAIYMTAYYSTCVFGSVPVTSSTEGRWPTPAFVSALFFLGFCCFSPFVITGQEGNRKS